MPEQLVEWTEAVVHLEPLIYETEELITRLRQDPKGTVDNINKGWFAEALEALLDVQRVELEVINEEITEEAMK